MTRHSHRTRFIVLLLALTFTALPGASAGNDGKILSLSDYSRWNRIVSTAISPDGTWVAYGYRANGGNDTLHVKQVATGKVDVWHWKDERVQSIQMMRADADRRATQRAAVDAVSGKLTLLTDEAMPTAAITDDGQWAVGRLDQPYRLQVSWGGSPADYYRVNTATGERTPIVKNVARTLGTSPDSRWFLYQRDKELWAFNLRTGAAHNISKAAGISFVDEDDDHPYEKPVYGVAGFSKDGTSVIVNHKFDLWKLPLDGGQARNLTGGAGAKDQIVFRIQDLDPDERAIDMSKPLLLSEYGEWTKQSGYYRLDPGGRLERLVYADRAYGRPVKARSADRLLFTSETFVEFPDYYVSGLDFSQPAKVTDANPQQAEYAWGRKVLVDYKNSKGVRLQRTLTLPAGYEQGRNYPMLVYFYEKMSNTHHRYSMPVYDDRPHMSTYASNGYLVFQPDVVYTTGRPGDSAVDCVTSAVRKVIELGYADSKRIGLQGHSWGGYQSSFIVTQPDMFAAVVTGAPVTNLVSFYNELYRSMGTVQHGITEVGQVRMGAGYFDNMALYHSQSPVHQAQKISTPFMILHGTEDGAVDWHQGLEFDNAAKRLGKQVILVSYPGEAHHLRKEENQKDFQVRMKAFFDHYLKGTPAPSWMTDGVPQLKKKKVEAGLVAALPFVQASSRVSAEEQKLVAQVDRTNPEALALLERVVNINSGSQNFDGVREVGKVFRAELDALGFKTSWVDGAPFKRAGHLVGDHPGDGRIAGTPRLLLIGHLDTVFEKDSPFQKFERIDAGHARGPGIIDMKGGDVVMIQALKALNAVGLLKSMNVVVVMTGDEEDSGEPLTLARAALVGAAKGADIAIGFENGPGDPKLAVTARRGTTGWEVRVTGKPAHSSQIFREDIGYGAVYELARILNGFREKMAGEAHLTFNPGVVLGGTTVEFDPVQLRGTGFGKTNVIAEHAVAAGDLRTLSKEQLAKSRQAMEQIVAASLPHTRATIKFDEGYPPMAPTPGNAEILAMYDRASQDLGFGAVTAVSPDRAGAADVSFVAGEITKIIDGVGLMGTDDHTVKETADLTTLPSQTKRMAVLLHRLVKRSTPK